MRKIITFSQNIKGLLGIKKGDVLYEAKEFENEPEGVTEPGIYMTQKGVWRVDIKSSPPPSKKGGI